MGDGCGKFAARPEGVNGTPDRYLPPMITRMRIPSMRSNHCVNAVYTALTPVPGITRVDIAIGSAVVEHDGRATPEALRAAIEVAGYAVTRLEEDRRRLA